MKANTSLNQLFHAQLVCKLGKPSMITTVRNKKQPTCQHLSYRTHCTTNIYHWQQTKETHKCNINVFPIINFQMVSCLAQILSKKTINIAQFLSIYLYFLNKQL